MSEIKESQDFCYKSFVPHALMGLQSERVLCGGVKYYFMCFNSNVSDTLYLFV